MTIWMGVVASQPTIIPVAISYLDTQLAYGSNSELLSPTVTNGAGSRTFALTGSLPANVSFDTTTGTFTGPPDSAWNFIAVQVSSGWQFTCAVTSTGGAKCWGSNAYGQLGDGTTTNRLTPVDVSGLTSGVASISTGEEHTCAVTTSGGVKCWGKGSNGRLGDGSTLTRLTPVDVSGLTSGVASVDAGSFHTCAVTTSGAAKCWGANSFNLLGDGTTTQRNTPITPTGLASGVASISASDFFNCAVTTSGGAKCWGRNHRGQLGDGTTTQRSTAVNVSGLTSGVASISAKSEMACVVTTSGGAKCWGYRYVGDGTTSQRLTPVDVSGLTSGVASISVSGIRSNGFGACVVTTSGGAKCWGNGYSGDGTTSQRLTPVNVSGLTSGVASVDSGKDHTCAVTTSGDLKCWGLGAEGQLADGNTSTEMGCSNPDFWSQRDCTRFGETWGAVTVGANSTTPTEVLYFDPQPGFPASVSVSVTDLSGVGTANITLTAA